MLRRLYLLVCVSVVLLVALFVPPTRAADVKLVAIQAGHWKTESMPDEFARLRDSTGAEHGGVAEVDLNVDVSHRIAEYLRSWGIEAYVLPAPLPPAYKADAFVSIHADGNSNRSARGYKVATYYRDWIASQTLVNEIVDEYGKQTGLPLDWRITENMRNYYAFNFGLYEHTVDEMTPSAIVEMGFLTNPQDRQFLVEQRDLVSRAIALGIARFLGARPAGGWPPPPVLIPRGDVVQVTGSRVTLHDGPGAEFPGGGTAWRNQRYAVIERQNGFAKLFAWNGRHLWIDQTQTQQVWIP